MHSFHLPSPNNPVTVKPVNVEAASSAAIPFEQWPIWAKDISKRKAPEDKGVGDTIRRTLGETFSHAFKAWFRFTFKRDCGCNARQEKWNKQYPY